MGYRNCWRSRKFYWTQVEQILAILQRFFKDTDIDLDKYLLICEQLGQEPDPDKMPPDRAILPYEVQVAFLLHDILPDRWDGMSGSYFGKDMSALGTLLDVYEVEDKKTVVYFLKHIEAYNSQSINKKLDEQRKSKERSMRAKSNIK